MKASWLVLERYALGECDPEEARQVEAALARDAEAQQMLSAIQQDRRVLPPLPTPLPRRGRTGLWAAGGALLLAAAALLVLGLQQASRDPLHLKGGDLSLELVALRDGLAVTPAEVAPGERLGLRLTCPPGRHRVQIVAFHDGEAAFPMRASSVECGNRVQLPGAFSVDRPGPLVVCAAVGDPPPREVLARGPEEADVCVEVSVQR